jgi:hypothetical protein
MSVLERLRGGRILAPRQHDGSCRFLTTMDQTRQIMFA